MGWAKTTFIWYLILPLIFITQQLRLGKLKRRHDTRQSNIRDNDTRHNDNQQNKIEHNSVISNGKKP